VVSRTGEGSRAAPEVRHARLLELLRALESASRGEADGEAALRALLAQVSAYLGWPLAHAYVVDVAGDGFEPTRLWYRDEPGKYQELVDATAGTFMRTDEGLVGKAMVSRRPEWLTDLSADAGFLRSRAAEASGLRTAVAVPVVGRSGVQAVLEFFSPRAEAPDEEVLTVLSHVGAAWGRVIETDRLESRLGQSERRFRAIVESAADAIILTDDRGLILSWNPSAARIFGYEDHEAIGRPLSMIMPERYRERHQAAFLGALDGSREVGGAVFEFEGLSKNGRQFPVELTVASWRSERRYFAGILRDITERRATEHELRLLASATEHLREAIVISTAGDAGHGPTILYVNAAFTRITGYTESEILGRSFSVLAGPKTDQGSLQAMHQFMRAGEAAAAEILAHRKDGGEFLMAWQATPITTPGTIPGQSTLNFVSILRDVTEERNTQQALSRADRDALTGLPNRDVLEKRLRRSIERARERDDYRYAVLFVDLDGFKKVNDDFGHVVGDQLLNSAAERLERTVRPGDTLARFGGDEFVILLEYVTGIADVIMVADRVQRRLETPFKLNGREHRVAASIGVALGETGYTDARDAIRDADRAMYEAKRKGKGRFEFSDQSLYSDVVAVLSLQEDLKRCLDRDELELHYQPLVDLSSGSIVGVEALVRWRHPELGLLLPDQFIPLAEETGVIVPLGRWVMRTACVDAQTWHQTQLSGEPLILSVNVSMRELTSADFVDSVASILKETRLAPERLQIELTESVFVETLEPIRSRIVAVRKLGVTVCIDDFGTGYSSLGHLHRLPIDKIKIDRLFVRDLDGAPGNREILRTILSLARHLDLDVVAEGVESNAQLMTLRELACAYGQGFLFSKPVPTHRVDALFVGDEPDDAAFAVG
jgi:diguanylate cyclase (GGDEF)-like protein/PAS domain S-box-containing protein